MMTAKHQVQAIAVGAALVLVAAIVLAAGGPRAATARAAPAASSAFVRVNQVGYPAAGSKRAYLMASADETGATFSVKDSTGATVYRAPVGATVGSWQHVQERLRARLRCGRGSWQLHDRGLGPGSRDLPELQDRHRA